MNLLENRRQFNFISFQRITGNLFFIAIFIYAIVYAVERVTYVDSAWLFYQGVNYENFSFSLERFGAFFSELPLFFAVKLHLPFKWLVYLFSLSYPVIYYLVWRICTYRLQNGIAGLVILLGMIMGVRETFLHTVTETHQVIVYSALFFALLEFEFKNNFLKNILINTTLVLVVFTHPFGIFTSGFALLYEFTKTKTKKNILTPTILLLLLTIGFFIYLWTGTTYNSVQFAHMKNASLSVPETRDTNAAIDFLCMHFKHFYWLPELVGLIITIFLIVKKEWLKLTALCISVVGYILIAFVTFRDGDSSIMLERIFLPAFFMINLAFADFLVNGKSINKWISMALVIFILVNGIHYINTGCLFYKKRVDYLDQIVKEGISKGKNLYFLSDEKTDMNRILVQWALGTETLIYSKFKYDKSISIVLKGETCSSGYFHTKPNSCQPISELNARYFQFSAKEYVELK